MQFQRNFCLAMMVLLMAGCSGCVRAQRTPQPQANERPSVAIKTTLTRTSTPEPFTPPPYAKYLPVSEAALLRSALKKVQPDYPPELQAKGITGEVRVQITIDVAGKVVKAEALSGPSELRSYAIQAAYQWRYREIDDVNVVLYVVGTLLFSFPPHT